MGELQISGFGGSKSWQQEVIMLLRLCETELNFYGTLSRLDSYLIFVSSLSFLLHTGSEVRLFYLCRLCARLTY